MVLAWPATGDGLLCQWTAKKIARLSRYSLDGGESLRVQKQCVRPLSSGLRCYASILEDQQHQGGFPPTLSSVYLSLPSTTPHDFSSELIFRQQRAHKHNTNIMPLTPAHIAFARDGAASSSTIRRLHPSDLIRVRKLYLEKRFKSCISTCEQLLTTPASTPTTPTFLFSPSIRVELHPVHRSFLIFHQAICYEYLGIAAHKFSQNKIQFLEMAKEKYQEALDVLPQLFDSDGQGCGTEYRLSSPDIAAVDDDHDESFYPDPADLDFADCELPDLRFSDDPGAISYPANESIQSDQTHFQIIEEELPDLQFANDPATIDDNNDEWELPELQFSDDPATWPPELQSHYTKRRPSLKSIGSVSSESTVTAISTVPDFNKYSARSSQHAFPNTVTPDDTPGSFSGGALRFEVQGHDLDFDEEDEDDCNETDHNTSWLPRSMRSLNLAAYTLNSGSDNDSYSESGSEEEILLGSGTPLSAAIKSLQVPASPSRIPRLRASSTAKTLQQDLLPPPLFNKTLQLPKLHFADLVHTSRDENVPPAQSLPRTPYTHHTHLTLLPVRKTAVQTLISKFEGTLPDPGTPSTTDSTPSPLAPTPAPLSARTPITPRFNNIHSTFAPKPSETQAHLQAYLTSRSLAQYNSTLSSFRTCLRNASASITTQLCTARDIQAERHASKHQPCDPSSPSRRSSLPTNRLASLWLLSTPPVTRTQRKSCNNSRTNLPPQPSSLSTRKPAVLRNKPSESEEKRSERIEKLRKCGWRVRKEGWGWKGEGFYEGFRRGVEAEIAC